MRDRSPVSLPDPPAPTRALDARVGLPAEQRVKLNEIFFSIQGESTAAGRPCVMVRLTGCQMRCVWCDTAYAFHQGEWRSLDEVLAEVATFGCRLVEVTGGEPLLQPGAFTLLTRLCDAGYEVLVETGGGVDIHPVDQRVRRIVDVKCPGSGELEGNLWANLDRLRAGDELKFVLADEADYLFARDLVVERGFGHRLPVHFSVVHGALDPTTLAAWILRDRLPVRLQLQLHKLLWDPRRRGV